MTGKFLRTLVIAIECEVDDRDCLTGPHGLVPPALRRFADMLETGEAGNFTVEAVRISPSVEIHTLHYTDHAAAVTA